MLCQKAKITWYKDVLFIEWHHMVWFCIYALAMMTGYKTECPKRSTPLEAWVQHTRTVSCRDLRWTNSATDSSLRVQGHLSTGLWYSFCMIFSFH